MAILHSYEESFRQELIDLSLRAWEPVYASIKAGMEPDVYDELHPDWRESQKAAVVAAIDDKEIEILVAIDGSRLAGFVAMRTIPEAKLGEIYLIAVDPEFQQKGIGKQLIESSIAWLKKEGMTVALVETGGDPGHEPARSAYISAGFRPFPIVKFFRML